MAPAHMCQPGTGAKRWDATEGHTTRLRCHHVRWEVWDTRNDPGTIFRTHGMQVCVWGERGRGGRETTTAQTATILSYTSACSHFDSACAGPTACHLFFCPDALNQLSKLQQCRQPRLPISSLLGSSKKRASICWNAPRAVATPHSSKVRTDPTPHQLCADVFVSFCFLSSSTGAMLGMQN